MPMHGSASEEGLALHFNAQDQHGQMRGQTEGSDQLSTELAMHTLMVVVGDLVLLVVCALVGRLLDWANGIATDALVFLPVWLVAAAINTCRGSRAGYTVAQEAPIFLRVFAAPASVALLTRWKRRGAMFRHNVSTPPTDCARPALTPDRGLARCCRSLEQAYEREAVWVLRQRRRTRWPKSHQRDRCSGFR